jgi:aminoglycoside phosphotransferase family enzyme/predicted kinase
MTRSTTGKVNIEPETMRSEQLREQLLPFLLDPNSYPHRPRYVRLKQTHCSYVLLVGPYAYKVKKPVDFGFLDFSTLEKRHYFSECEVMLNRRLCPDMYLGIVPISLYEGRLVFGLVGEIVEYAIKMKKLEDRYFMLRLLKKGQIGPRELDRLVLTLKTFYEAQKPAPEITAWGGIEKLKLSTDENFRQTEDFIGFTISSAAFETIRFYTDNFYLQNSGLFEARIREQRIRDCHGDLHLEHIHISPTRLSIYDCIEFNDRFRYLDVANDIAFLAMDLDFQGRQDLSRQFTEKMADALNDQGMLRLMLFYKCYRAYVRGKVETFHQNLLELPESERKASRALAVHYFCLALEYVVCGLEPLVVVVMGRPASGKSTLARSLGRELGWEVFSSDRTRKKLAGVPLYRRGRSAMRRRLYSEEMTNRTYSKLLQEAVDRLGERRNVTIDATFGSRQHRAELGQKLGALGVDYCLIETQASDETLKSRLIEREGRTDEVSDARLEDFEVLAQSYEAPVEAGQHRLITMNAERSPELTLVETLKALAYRTLCSPKR